MARILHFKSTSAPYRSNNRRLGPTWAFDAELHYRPSAEPTEAELPERLAQAHIRQNLLGMTVRIMGAGEDGETQVAGALYLEAVRAGRSERYPGSAVPYERTRFRISVQLGPKGEGFDEARVRLERVNRLLDATSDIPNVVIPRVVPGYPVTV